MARNRDKKPLHTWTEDDRLLLCMCRLLNYSRQSVGLIWNKINERKLRREGFSAGVPLTTLDAQYNEIKGGGKGYACFNELLHLDEQGLKGQYTQTYDNVMRTARCLRLYKETRTARHRNPGQHRAQLRRRRRAASLPTTISVESLETSDQDDLIVTNPFLVNHMFRIEEEGEHQQDHGPNHTIHNPGPMNTLRRIASTTPYPPVLRVTRKAEEDKKSRLVLLFRAFEPEHGFRARRFLQTNNIPAPPVAGTNEFKDLVWPHLHRSVYCDSSFVSLTSSSKDALRRIELDFSKDGTERSLAIFSFDTVSETAVKRYGSASGFYHVRSFFEKDEISDLPDGYTGPSEWLAYGSIDCAPIGVISCGQAIRLAKALRRLKRQDAESLNDIRECLSGIPSLWKQVVAFELLTKYVGKKLPKPYTSQFTKLMCELYRKSETAHAEPDLIVQRYIDHQWVHSSAATSQEEYEEDFSSQDSNHARRSPSAVRLLHTLTGREDGFGSVHVAPHHSDRATEIDWDPYDDEAAFASEFPSASKKKIYTTQHSTSSPDRILPSVEGATSPEQFVAQLISSATKSYLLPPAQTEPKQCQTPNGIRPQCSGTGAEEAKSTPIKAEDMVIDLTLGDDETELKPKEETKVQSSDTIFSNTFSSSPPTLFDPPTPTPIRPPDKPPARIDPLVPDIDEVMLDTSSSRVGSLYNRPRRPLIDYPDSDLE